MRVLLLPNFTKSKTRRIVYAVRSILEREGAEAVGLEGRESVDESMEGLRLITVDEIPTCDLLLAIGGDGTMIQSAYYSAVFEKPIAGVDAGTLGYLAQIDEDALETSMKRLLNGEYMIQKHAALHVQWDGGESAFVLNDILIRNVDGKITDFQISCDGMPISHYRADAFLFSTPTGSTAHLMAYGGPILEPGVQAVVLKAVGAQLGEPASIVFPLEHRFTAVFNQSMQVICDGKTAGILDAQESLTITKSDYEALFVCFHPGLRVHRIQEKLFFLNHKAQKYDFDVRREG